MQTHAEVPGHIIQHTNYGGREEIQFNPWQGPSQPVAHAEEAGAISFPGSSLQSSSSLLGLGIGQTQRKPEARDPAFAPPTGFPLLPTFIKLSSATSSACPRSYSQEPWPISCLSHSLPQLFLLCNPTSSKHTRAVHEALFEGEMDPLPLYFVKKKKKIEIYDDRKLLEDATPWWASPKRKTPSLCNPGKADIVPVRKKAAVWEVHAVERLLSKWTLIIVSATV